MFQILKKSKLRYILLMYISVEAFRHIGWMLFYEQFVEGTRQEINLGFIFYSFTIFITALMILKLPFMRRIQEKGYLNCIFIIAVCCAFTARMLQLLCGLTGAYIFMTIWTAAIMVCICICYQRIYEIVPKKMLGGFFGFAYFVDALVVSFVELFTGTTAYYIASVAVAVFLCILAVVFFVKLRKNNDEDDLEQLYSELHDWKLSKRFMLTALSAMIIYVLIAGMTDNLYFFDDWMELPYVGLFTLPMMGIMYFVSGVLFDKLRLRITLPLAVICICMAQTMTFFVTDSSFAYSYSIFSNLGSTFLQLAVVIVPIIYAREYKRCLRVTAIGEGLFYGGFCVGSIVFLFIDQSAYRIVMGGILLAAVLCLVIILDLVILYEKHKHKKEIEKYETAKTALEERLAITDCLTPKAVPQVAEIQDNRFTKKEKELMPLVISSLTAEEIAERCNLSASTVRFHIKNILHKTSAANRRELIRIFEENRN